MKEIHIQERHHIQHTLLTLAEGDADFKNQLSMLYRINFQNLKERFRDIMINRDIEELAFINHKYRTTFLMFDLRELAAEMEKGKSMLEANTPDPFQLNQVVHKVEDYCTEILNEFSEVI